MKPIFPSIIRLVLSGFLLAEPTVFAQQKIQSTKTISITQVRIESVEFQEADLPTVLNFLGTKAREGNGNPANFLLYDPVGKIRKRNPRITLSLRNIPLSQVLKYVSDTSGTELQVDRHAALFLRKADLPLLKKLRNARLIPKAGAGQINQLRSIVIPQIDLQDTTLREAIEFLRLKTWQSCAPESPPNFVIRPSAEFDSSQNTFSLKLNNVSLLTALQYVTELGGRSMRFDSRAIIIATPDRLVPIKLLPRQKNPQFDLILKSQIEEISIEEASLPEVIQLIGYYSKNPAIAPDGPNFIIAAKSDKTVTLNLRRVRGIDVLRYLNELTGTNFRVDQNAITIIDAPAPKLKAGRK